MIVSSNPEPHRKEFDSLLQATVTELSAIGKNKPTDITSRPGDKLESYICDIMKDKAVGTPFDKSITLIGGQKFPDIVALQYYGVEVKTTTQNHWKTTGNSVLESTRVDNVERIFMLFAKLFSPVEFKCRPYEEVLSEVVVTHSPRYLIDMDLPTGNTIFDKINLPYDKMRKEKNPIAPIVDYYKKKLKPGEELWWIDPNGSKPQQLVIRLWNNLSRQEKAAFLVKAFAYFPEVLSSDFNSFTIWLVTNQSVVCPNVRDMFTAGGKVDIIVNGKNVSRVPRVISNLQILLPDIIETVINTPTPELVRHWGTIPRSKKKVAKWIDLIDRNGSKLIGSSGSLKKLVHEMIIEYKLSAKLNF